MFSLHRRHQASASDLLTSQLFDQNTFYRTFIRDLSFCTSEALIESPFITSNRVASLLPIFGKMRSRNVRITIITRDPTEHDAPFDTQAANAIDELLDMGVQVIYMGGYHRKLAILDRAITWEGSLNILSQGNSCEIMRKITSQALAEQMINFLRLNAQL